MRLQAEDSRVGCITEDLANRRKRSFELLALGTSDGINGNADVRIRRRPPVRPLHVQLLGYGDGMLAEPVRGIIGHPHAR